ncbi:coa binding domain containing protein [Anaeramoeba flamelloides]|uniref:Coa binding domain containing protein n=1 Tax=Anaeramoeba flamelloides TaxID=1746091 RepID=A0AAV7YV42_9EUKA|nr:coa binding domain containing protein [Anaeramoeba flamelloides]
MLKSFYNLTKSYTKTKIVRNFGLSKLINKIETHLMPGTTRPGGLLAEHEVYDLLDILKVPTPLRYYHSVKKQKYQVSQSNDLKNCKKVVAKGVLTDPQGRLVIHKTDLGALEFNIEPEMMGQIVKKFDERFSSMKGYTLEGVLFVEQSKIEKSLSGELLISAYQDDFFGPSVAFGLGGTTIEYMKEIMKPGNSQMFIPVLFDNDSFSDKLQRLPVTELLEGRVRGVKPKLRHEKLLAVLDGFSTLIETFSAYNPKTNLIIDEIEVNPAVCYEGELLALDGVLRVRKKDADLDYQTTDSIKPLNKIKNLLCPQSIAIAGASTTNEKNPGNIILRKMLEKGIKKENVFLLHPKAKKINGINCYPSVKELSMATKGNPVDLMLIGVPAKHAGPLVEQCLDYHVSQSMSIISGGFGETEKGKHMQDGLEKRLRKLNSNLMKRPVINGPNTVGNVCNQYWSKSDEKLISGVETVFTSKSSSTGKGNDNACLLCQSGAFMLSRISDLADLVYPSVSISVGNQMDLSIADYLEHLIDSPHLTSFGLYIEGLNKGDGIRLMKLVRRATQMGKFVTIYKAGRTKEGADAAKGHTAAIAGDYGMFKTLLEHAGAIVADGFEEFNQLLITTTRANDWVKPLRKVQKNKKIGVGALSNAGFEKCGIADHIITEESKHVLQLPEWSQKTMKQLTQDYKDFRIGSIVDIDTILDLTPMVSDKGYDQIIRTVLSDPNVHFGILSAVPETEALKTFEHEMHQKGSLLNRLIQIKKDMPEKPFVVVIESGPLYAPFVKALNVAGIPTFRSVDVASKISSKLIQVIRKY